MFAVYPGPVDTEMAAGLPVAKAAPRAVAAAVLDGLAAGTEDIFPDPVAEQIGRAFLSDPKALERQAGTMLG